MKKIIRKGDIVRIRHNSSGHYFPENTLGVVLETHPRFEEVPVRLKVATAKEWWYVGIEDVTLFKRKPRTKNEEEDW